MFKSTNEGETWTTAGLTDARVSALAVDPAAPDTLYTGTAGRGVFKSTDGARSWRSISTGLLIHFISALTIDPLHPNQVYAAGFDGGVFKSTDGGDTWSVSGLTDITVDTLALNPVTPSTLYVGTKINGVAGAVFKSTDAGDTWSDTGLRVPSNPGDPSVGSVNDLAIDPVTPDTLYAGTGGGVFKSRDAAATWNVTNAGLSNTSVGRLATDPIAGALYASTPNSTFRSIDGAPTWVPTDPDFSVLAVDPANSNTLYAAGRFISEGGPLFKSDDSGITWVDTHLTVIDVNAIAFDPITPATLYAGSTYCPGETCKAGTVSKSVDAGASWTVTPVACEGPVVALAIDPITPTTLYAGTRCQPFDPCDTGAVCKSTDAGMTWTSLNAGGFAALNALAIDPKTPVTLYAATETFVDGAGGVFKSTDAGET